MATVQKQPLAHNVPIVDARGLPTPEFQRVWQGLSHTAAQGGVAPDTYVRRGLLTGWASPTGTFARTTFAAYAAPAISAAYSQAEVQALGDHVELLSQDLAALIVDLKSIEVLKS
jgi:hypothetical protein